VSRIDNGLSLVKSPYDVNGITEKTKDCYQFKVTLKKGPYRLNRSASTGEDIGVSNSDLSGQLERTAPASERLRVERDQSWPKMDGEYPN